MFVKAKAKYVRISPRKIRLVADAIRGLDLVDAINRLALLPQKAVTPITKVVKSALASAEHNYNLVKDNLFIKEITVNDGPTFYRWMPKAHGRATPIRKRTSMIDLVLAEKVESESKSKSKKKVKINTTETDEVIENQPGKMTSPDKKALTGAGRDAKAEKGFDVKKQSGPRDVQKVAKTVKKEKGTFKKMFNRKSGM